MNETNYPGIDYSGTGSDVNRDSETRIRYGIISQNALNPDVSGEIGGNDWRDLGFENAAAELKGRLRQALDDYFHGDRLKDAVDAAFDACDGWADNIESGGPYYQEADGYRLQTDDSNDLWVFKSPFYTYAQFCSPCAPGACHLEHPLNVKIQAGIASVTHDGTETFVAANKCYCLGHDWLEDGKAPYRLFRVDNNEEVLPV